MQINSWLHLSNSLCGPPLCCDLFREIKDQENFILLQQKLNCISCLMYSKIFFAPNFSIFQKGSAEEGETGNFEVLCLTSKRNKKLVTDDLCSKPANR